ncbi:MAG: hypothetical protein KA765_05085 [Thermoflexales bacterium]|nr:hypothetical protein [Thermoflexales bacterium]
MSMRPPLLEKWEELNAIYQRPTTEFDNPTLLRDMSALEARFIELLTFAAAEDVIVLLEHVYQTDLLSMPVWMRNLAFRLVCLQQPMNATIRHAAAQDLRCFGPDWDVIADQLEQDAILIEQQRA